jgi:hypothetical protein
VATEGEESTEGAEEPSGGSAREDAARQEIQQALLGGMAYPLHHLPPTKDELERAHLQQDLELKERYGNRLLGLVTFQLAVADFVFVLYLVIGVHWRPPAGVMYVWLSTTLVELVGVATVVTRYLFPRRDSGASESNERS